MSKQEESMRFIEDLIVAVSEDVEKKIEDMEPEECMQFTREFLEKMTEWQPDIADGDGITAAAASMFLAMMFVPAFSKAYEFTNNFLTAREALYKAMGENGNV